MRFVEQAVIRAGLGEILRARRAGEIEMIRAKLAEWKDADLLALGAVADLVRSEEVGDAVTIHREGEGASGIFWIDPQGATELEVLRAVAIARIAGPPRARIGIDWSRHGLELAQVALGFGASHLRGAITRKSGLPILDDESKKVKGQGNVSLASLKKAEIAALVKHAGRLPAFTDETPAFAETEAEAAAHV
jgi:2-iminoacetate synthase ThiH